MSATPKHPKAPDKRGAHSLHRLVRPQEPTQSESAPAQAPPERCRIPTELSQTCVRPPFSLFVRSLLCPSCLEMELREKMCRLQRKAKFSLDLWQRASCPELKEPDGTILGDDNVLEFACDELIRMFGPNANIGYPKLFMVGKASAAELWPRLTVNNFVAARGEPIRVAVGSHVPVSVNRFSRPGGPGLLTHGRCNDYEFYRPARRAGLGPLTTAQEGVAVNSMTTLLYCRRPVKPAGDQKHPD